MGFTLIVSKQASEEIKKWKKSGQPAKINKIKEIIAELEVNPFSEEFHFEKLKYDLQDYYSKRIDLKNRIVYSVNKEEETVTIHTAIQHYTKKQKRNIKGW